MSRWKARARRTAPHQWGVAVRHIKGSRAVRGLARITIYILTYYIYSVYTQNFRYMRYTHSSGNWGGGALESRIDHWEHYVPKCVCV